MRNLLGASPAEMAQFVNELPVKTEARHAFASASPGKFASNRDGNPPDGSERVRTSHRGSNPLTKALLPAFGLSALDMDRFANGRLPITSDNGQSASGRAQGPACASAVACVLERGRKAGLIPAHSY